MKILSVRLTREVAMTEYRTWNEKGRIQKPNPRLLLGLFYTHYQQRYGYAPMTTVEEDLRQMTTFFSRCSQNLPLAPFIIDALFSLKNFTGISVSNLLNTNIVTGWGLLEKANQLMAKPMRGEQAEFKSDHQRGVIRV